MRHSYIYQDQCLFVCDAAWSDRSFNSSSEEHAASIFTAEDSVTLVNVYQTTWRYIPEDSNLQVSLPWVLQLSHSKYIIILAPYGTSLR
jgi:hypothetical protein